MKLFVVCFLLFVSISSGFAGLIDSAELSFQDTQNGDDGFHLQSSLDDRAEDEDEYDDGNDPEEEDTAEDIKEEQKEEEEVDDATAPQGGKAKRPAALNKRIRLYKYNRHIQIQKYMRRLVKDYPRIVKRVFASVKKTYEGRKLTYLKIGKSPEGERTKSVWIDAGIHAREWIAPAAALYTIDQLVRVFIKKDAGETLSAEEEDVAGVNWLVMPLLNPDGYEYAHTVNRTWRKNRVPDEATGCYGVDLNRNFDVVGWGTGLASKDPCSYYYTGKSAGSELEVQMASDVLKRKGKSIRVSIAIHSWGEFMFLPWGYTTTLPDNYQEHVDFGERMNVAIKKVNGRTYRVAAGWKLFKNQTAGGSSMDYSKAAAGIPLAMTLELPGRINNVTYGFDLPEREILPICKEVWAAMSVVAKTARDEPFAS